MSTLDTLLEVIAVDELGLKTLETRNSDSLDFYDVAVWKLRAALRRAYQAGCSQIEDGITSPRFTPETPIPNDVTCELAHELTVRECLFKQIPLDVEGDEETIYSDAAQLVFDQIYDIISRVLHGYVEEVAP
jgi:hypothetical protein